MLIINLCLMACSVFFIVYLFFLRPDFYVDNLRDRLFLLRNKLFDYAADPNSDLEFDEYVYGYCRCEINNTIRFAHRVNIWSFVLAQLIGLHTCSYYKIRNERIANKFAKELTKKSVKTEKFIREIQDAFDGIMISHLVDSSLLAKIILVNVVLISSIRDSMVRFCRNEAISGDEGMCFSA